MTPNRYPDQLNVRLPPGWRSRIESLAARDGRSPVEWARRLFRRALDAADRSERRRKAARKSAR